MTQEEKEKIANELHTEGVKNNVSLPARLWIADYLVTDKITLAILQMYKENPGLTEDEYVDKAKKIYYELGGHLVPEGEEE